MVPEAPMEVPESTSGSRKLGVLRNASQDCPDDVGELAQIAQITWESKPRLPRSLEKAMPDPQITQKGKPRLHRLPVKQAQMPRLLGKVSPDCPDYLGRQAHCLLAFLIE